MIHIVSLLLLFYMDIVHLRLLLTLKSILHHHFFRFFLVCFSVLRFNLDYIIFHSHVSLRFFTLWNFSKFLWHFEFFLLTMTVLSITSQMFYRISLNWDLYDAFLKTGLRVFWEKNYRCTLHFHHILLSVYSINMTYCCDDNLNHLSWDRFCQDSSTINLLLLFLHPIVYFWEESHYTQPKVKK